MDSVIRLMRALRPLAVSGAMLAVIVSAGVGAGTASAAPAHGYPASAAVTGSPPVNSTFSLCAGSGTNKISCFTANLHFISKHKFRLTKIVLKDPTCDNRNAFAAVASDTKTFKGTHGGSTDGKTYTYINSGGCHGSPFRLKKETFTETSHVISFVRVRVFACGDIISGCSSTRTSKKHFNPFA
jgi:hypothetical protein